MEKPQQLFNLAVDVRIESANFSNGAVTIRENVPIKAIGFREMADILEAFHVLIEKYRFK